MVSEDSEGRGAGCECPISVDDRFCVDIDGAHDVSSSCLSFCGAVWPGRQKLHTGLPQGHLDRGRPGLTSLGAGVLNVGADVIRLHVRGDVTDTGHDGLVRSDSQLLIRS